MPKVHKLEDDYECLKPKEVLEDQTNHNASKCWYFFINNIFHTNKKSLLAEIRGFFPILTLNKTALRRKKLGSELECALNSEIVCALNCEIVCAFNSELE